MTSTGVRRPRCAPFGLDAVHTLRRVTLRHRSFIPVGITTSVLLSWLVLGCAEPTDTNFETRSAHPRTSTPEDVECLQATDGSRLRRRGFRGEDGSFYGLSWTDTAIGGYCEFVPTGERTMHCLPVSAAIPFVHLDPECNEQPVTFRAGTRCDDIPTGTPYRYMVKGTTTIDESSCATHEYRVFEVGPRLDLTQTTFGPGPDGPCSPEDWSALNVEFFEIGDEVSLDTFVAVENEEVVGDRLSTLRRVMSDGSVDYYTYGPYDEALQTTCDPKIAADGQLRCLPSTTASVRFLDDECAQSVTQYGEPCPGTLGPTVSYALEPSGSCAHEVTRVYEVGTPDEVSEVATSYEKLPSDGSCNESVAGRFAPLGPEVPAESMASGSMDIRSCGPLRRGGSRLAVLNVEWGGGLFHTGDFFDLELEVRCAPGVAADGATRCLPMEHVEYGPATHYADAACSVEAIGYSCPASQPGLPTVPRFAVIRGTPDECQPARSRVYSLAAGELTAVYYLSHDECVPAMSKESMTYRALGPEVPATDLVEFTLDD